MVFSFLFLYCSYINENTKCSAAYKLYNKQIPAFLHNCANYLVEHCMKRLVYAEDVNSVNLVDASIGEFSVPSETKSHNYNVFFKAPHDNEIPTCECLDWQRNYLPANTYWRSFKIKDMTVGIGKSCRQNIESVVLYPLLATFSTRQISPRDAVWIFPPPVGFTHFSLPPDSTNTTRMTSLSRHVITFILKMTSFNKVT